MTKQLNAHLTLQKFQQSKSTKDFKEHYDVVQNHARKVSSVFKLGRGYFDWEFFVRPLQVEKQLERDVKQLQGYLSPLGERDSREILLAYESNFGNYRMENVAFSAGVLSTFSRISEVIRKNGCEELLIATPNYPQLEEDAIRHGPVRLVAASKGNKYNLTVDEVEKNLNGRTSGVVLLNPNVTGVYQDKDELGKIIDLLTRKGVFLIIDETNDTIQWKTGGMEIGEAGKPFVARPHYPDNIDSPCVIRQRSFSKGDMLAEYRIGYVVAMPDVIAALEQSVGANTPPSSATEAVKWIVSMQGKWAAATKGAIPPYPANADEMDYARELTVNSLYMDAMRSYVAKEVKKIKGAEIIMPENGFIFFFRVEGFGGWQLFEKLLYGCNFAVNPGPCFGFNNNDGWVRITLGNSPDKMQEAMGRMNAEFPRIAKHERFVFPRIGEMRLWENAKTKAEDFLP